MPCQIPPLLTSEPFLPAEFYRFTPAQIHATIIRFYMMTRTSLSAATRAQRDESARNSSFQPQPLVYPEARRALIHPRNPFPATSHPLVLRTAEANEGPLATEVPSANADASSIGILSDQRESKGLSYRSPLRHQRPQLLIANLELESHLTHQKTQLTKNH